MNTVNDRARGHLSIIAGARLIELLRWARHHLYVLLILSPLVLGLTYFGVSRLLLDNDWRPSRELAIIAGIAVTAALVVLSMSRAGGELYHLRRPEIITDTLPVSVDTHLHAAVIERLSRTLFVGLALVFARTLGGGALDQVVVLTVALFVLLLALTEIVAALIWIHWSHLRNVKVGLSGLALLLLFSSTGGGLLVSSVGRENFPSGFWKLSLISALISLLVLGPTIVTLHRIWRAADLEYVRRLRERNSSTLIPSWLMKFWKESSVTPLLGRDLTLTLRGFSSAVYLAFGLAALWILAVSGLLTSGIVANVEPPAGIAESTWLPTVMAIKVASVLCVVSMSVLTPLLVAHQIPHLWLERSTGVKGADLSRAKLWYARAVSLPTAILAWLAGVMSGGCPLIYSLPLLIETLWLWWLVSTVAGGLAFEVPDQPGLAAVLTLCAGLATGLFVAFLWPLGFALYALGIGELCRRGEHRARFHLLAEAE